jgi:hypothetical protein
LDDPRASTLPNTGAGSAFRRGGEAASVDPITHPATGGDREQIPPRPQPPPLDDEPPPDEEGPTPATVDPITGR